MLLAFEAGFIVFVLVIVVSYVGLRVEQKARLNRNLSRALSVHTPDAHELLMSKYDCVMTEEEMTELNRQNWR